MKKMIGVLMLTISIVILSSCGVTHEDLTGGKWVATAGYENGEISGESRCGPIGTLEFIDEESAIISESEEFYNYELEKIDNGSRITFQQGRNVYGFEVEMISDNEMGFIGASINEKYHCYLERHTEE